MKPSSRPITPRRYKWLWLFVALAVVAHLAFLTVLGLTAYHYKPPYWGKDISQEESAARWSARLPVLEEAMQRYGVNYRETGVKKSSFKRELKGFFPDGKIDIAFENENGLERWTLAMTVQSDHFIGDSPEDQVLVEMAAAFYSVLGGDMYAADFIEEELAGTLLYLYGKFVPMESAASPEAVGEAESYFGRFFVGEVFIRVRQQRPDRYTTLFHITACTRK